MKEQVLADRENCRNVANKLKFYWLHSILLQTGMNLDNCFPEDNDPDNQTIDQKARLRKTLNDNDILVLDDNEEVRIYVQNEVIAEWYKPQYNLNHDPSQLNPKKKFYVSIELNYWSVFENETNSI